ncbi:MAG: AI-2E family transporter [Hyphomicrobiales bacterium]|nr:AI-2E family transporter [Hyphomicrobiales bacterium]
MSAAQDPKGEHEAAVSVNTVAVLLIVFVILLLFYLIHAVLLPFVLAGGGAFVLTPLVDWLSRKTRASRAAVAMAVFLALAGLIALAAYLVIPSLFGEAIRVAADLQTIIEQPLERALGSGKIQLFGQPTSASELASSVVATVRQNLAQSGAIGWLLGSAFGATFGCFVTLTLLAYFLLSGRQIVTGLLWLFPPGWRPQCAQVMTRVRPILFRYFAGVAGVVIYASLAAYLGLGVFLQLKHAGILAALTGLLEILPVIGPLLSAVVAGLAALQQAKDLWSIVAYAIYATLLRLSIDQLVGPIVLGSAGRIHPALVIFCFLAGGVLFGIAGVILAVPAALTVRVALATIYEEPVPSHTAKTIGGLKA